MSSLWKDLSRPHKYTLLTATSFLSDQSGDVSYSHNVKEEKEEREIKKELGIWWPQPSE